MLDELDEPLPPHLTHRVVVPLGDGRAIVVYLPKPLSEHTTVEALDIVEALKREVNRRGKA